jgi:serine/threonine protein kinase
MTQTVADFSALLLRSRLLDPAQVDALLQRWQTVALCPEDLDAFIAWLQVRHGLTSYQTTLLTEGKADNFYLHHYKILDRVGKGRMAGVYRAIDENGQPVALKVLPPSRARDPESLARFKREATLATQLDHPCVVRTHAYGEYKGLHYLVMEYLEGKTLEQVLAVRGKLQPREATRLGLLAARGLQHIHDQGMIHRDFKPANLMLCPGPLPQETTWGSVVKILDIGLGRLLFDPDSPDGGGELTSDGETLGSPDYMAPEQARDPRRADARSDLYGLGCILYHCVAGTPPFPDDNLLRQILRHATQAPRPLREVVPETPADLARTVEVLLEKDPNARYPDAATAAEVLRKLL